MTLEQTLSGWTGPASASEQEKQERTERMIRQAISAHPPFSGVRLSIYAKGSYPNNTNVRADSDVDVAVQCHEAFYWGEHDEGAAPPITPYPGPWAPERLRAEVEAALHAKFPGQVSTAGTAAIEVRSSSARVEAHVVPSFDYLYYFRDGTPREGIRIFRTTGETLENYPKQQLANGVDKNNRTSRRYKPAVRILKRAESAMLEAGAHCEVPSFLIESLVYNCPRGGFALGSWTQRVGAVLTHIWQSTQGEVEPDNSSRLVEVNECKYLFGPNQKWTRSDARAFSYRAWNYLGLGK